MGQVKRVIEQNTMADVTALETGAGRYDLINQIRNTYEVTLPPISFSTSIFGREIEAREIFDRLSQKGVLVVVNGIGGIGKTTLCKHLYRNAREIAEQRYEHIAWINYNNNVAKSFIAAFRHLEIPMDMGESDEEKFEKIIYELNRLGDKLLIFIDNVDSSRKYDKQLMKLLQLKSHIIISSRLKLFDEDFLYPLGFLNDESARNLFCWHYKYAYEQKTKEAALYLQELIYLCGNHALTIELVAKTINSNRLTIRKALKMLKREKFDLSGFKDRVLCDWDDRQNEEDLDSHINKVFSVFKLTEIQKNVLNRLALLDASHLKIEYVKKILNISDREINIMIDKGWIIGNESEILMHKVIKYAVNRQRKDRISCYYDVLRNMEVFMRWKNTYSELDGLVLHAEEVFREFYRCKNDKEHMLADNISNYYLYQGDMKASASYLKKEISVLKRYEDSDIKIAECQKKMAAVYLEMEDMHNAVKMLGSALRIRKRYFHPISLEIAECYAHIGYMYQENGEYKKSISNYMKALNIRIQKDGENGKTTAWTYNNLGMVYGLIFEHQKGIYYIDQAIAIRENIARQSTDKIDNALLGVAQSESIKGSILLEQKKYEEAYEILQHSYEIRKKYLNDRHIITATAKQRLAVALCMLNRLEDAARLISEAMEVFFKSAGDHTIDIVMVYNTYGLIEQFRGNFLESERAHLSAIRILIKRFSGRHPKLLKLYESLGDAYKYFNKVKEAEVYYYKALKAGNIFLENDSWKISEIRNKCKMISE